MENLYYFKIYYNKMNVWAVTAHTKWEAVEKAYQRFIVDKPNIKRELLSARKLY